MKKIFLIFALLISFQLFAEKPKLAVMNFTDETEGKLSKDLVKNGSKLVRARFTRYANSFFDIVTDQENEAALAAMKKKSREIDRDRNFQIELGKQVSAAKIVILTIGSLDQNTFLITSTLIDVKRGIDETAADAIFDGSAKSLIEAVDEIIKQLLGNATNLAKEETESETRKKEQTRLETAKAESELLKAKPKLQRTEEESRKILLAQEKFKTIEWSTSYIQRVMWHTAQQYCQDLNENGHNDWRLPTIDEWRSTFRDCPNTELGGQCQISEINGKLDADAFSIEECKAGCPLKGYSTQEGKGWFWSSSSMENTDHFFVIAFKNARISHLTRSKLGSVRCVRGNK